ncbi:hypothetical protein OG394_20980 [Kribbella sp. NBC_01245]|uniref:hypothetical protein n=1 Tax=Kribbella sp. NBC_01245 TaxID=2903578 RepID=UPI002E280147|nr:hypothetical protein [Kribbella sp. NBC_01245]
MKTPFLIAISLTAGLLTSVPSAASEIPPAPTGVRISWADSTHERIRVTWTDTGTGNRIHVKTLSGSTSNDAVIDVVDASAPNQLVFSKYRLPVNREAVELQVTSGSSAGTSAPARSVRFDTTYAPATRITYAIPQSDGKVRLSWTRAAMPIDRNPGDPLDVAFDPDLLTPTVLGDKAYPVPSGTRSFVLPARPAGYRVAVASRNEWGESPSADLNHVEVGRMQPQMFKIPSYSNYGFKHEFELLPRVLLCPATQSCEGSQPQWRTGSASVALQLQARNNASAPWQIVERSNSGLSQIFTTAIGTRQYRVVVPTWAPKYPVQVTPWMATGPYTVATGFMVYPAPFNDGNHVSLGRRATSLLKVEPAVNLKVALQKWTGKTWAHVQYVQLSKGAGSATVTATKRGETLYRYVIPNTTWAGRPITGRIALARLTVPSYP